MDIDDVIYDLAHGFPGGVAAMALRVGENKNTLQLRVDPLITTHHTPAKLAAKMADVANSDELAKAFAERRNMICIHVAQHKGASDMELLDLILAMEEKKGQWFASIKRGLADGVLDPVEHEAIKKDCMEYQAALAEYISRIDSIVQERRTRPRDGRKRSRGARKRT